MCHSQRSSRWCPPLRKLLRTALPAHLTPSYQVHHKQRRTDSHLVMRQHKARGEHICLSLQGRTVGLMDGIVTEEQRGVSHWPAHPQARLLLQLPLQPDLEAHPALPHPVGEPAARPQQRAPSPEPRLAAGTVRTHPEVEVTVIWAPQHNELNILTLCRLIHVSAPGMLSYMDLIWPYLHRAPLLCPLEVVVI